MSAERNFVVRIDGQTSPAVRKTLEGGIQHGIVNHLEPGGSWGEAESTASGGAYFLVGLRANNAEEAERRVRQLFAEHPTLRVGRAELRLPAPAPAVQGRYDAIFRRAVEHLVAELIAGYAAEQERLARATGLDEPIRVAGVSLRGSAPTTTLVINTFQPALDSSNEDQLDLWEDPAFVRAVEGLHELDRWVADLIAMRLRGG